MGVATTTTNPFAMFSVSRVRCNFGGVPRGSTPILLGSRAHSRFNFLLSPHGCHGSFRVALWHLDTPSGHSFEAHLSVGLLPSVGVPPLLLLRDPGCLDLQVPQADPKLVEAPGQRDSASAELDEMRCLWARRLMTVIFVFAMLRLILHEAGASHPYNLTNLVMATLGLFFFSFPRLINPSNQDVWYVAVMLSLDASILVQVPEVDVRDVVPFAFAGRILYAVLAKRIGCVVFCVLVHLLQAIQISRSQEDPPGILYGAHNLVPMFLMMFVCIIAVRRLVRENVVLRVDLQKRTVELGAVSSLLTACYDAVIEVDHTLSLTQDSGQLASMLLQTAPKAGGLSGKSLLDFFAEEDKQRISEQVFSSGSENVSVALNADMLDSDFNRVKVELFCAQFKNLANERCFLVGLREMQDLEPLERTGVTPSASIAYPMSEGENLIVMYDVYTFDLHMMNSAMRRLCQAYLGDTVDCISELASHDSRPWLNQQLQRLGNCFASHAFDESQATHPKDPQDPNNDLATVTFNLLGISEAKAFVTIEHDAVLESWIGTMVIHLTPHTPDRDHANLTESNLKTLHSLPIQHSHAGHGYGLHGLQVVQSLRPQSPSSRSQTSHRSARSHRSGGSPHGSPAAGAISDLHSDGDRGDDLKEIITKLPLWSRGNSTDFSKGIKMDQVSKCFNGGSDSRLAL